MQNHAIATYKASLSDENLLLGRGPPNDTWVPGGPPPSTDPGPGVIGSRPDTPGGEAWLPKRPCWEGCCGCCPWAMGGGRPRPARPKAQYSLKYPGLYYLDVQYTLVYPDLGHLDISVVWMQSQITKSFISTVYLLSLVCDLSLYVRSNIYLYFRCNHCCKNCYLFVFTPTKYDGCTGSKLVQLYLP